ncbi:MAG: hypothetical protein HYU74_03180 [Dechloromonas sp.]|nr:hypothetical protein [Dechloromonas sp.]
MAAYGLLPSERFVVVTGHALAEEPAQPALWYFRHETIAVPRDAMAGAGAQHRLAVWDDLRAWHAATPVGSELALPPLIWLGAPDVLRRVELGAAGRAMCRDGSTVALELAPKLPLNRAYFDRSSEVYFRGQPLKLRGVRAEQSFVARCFWPENFRLPENPVQSEMAAELAALRAWVRAQPSGGAREPFSVESIWRRPGSSGPQAGQAVLGLMLNGAQGDDDEAHSGHFALMTGYVGEQGAIDDWLVNNFYTLDSESEKGIIAAPVPLDNYLGDLNSGQAWYRPSYMLLAMLDDARTAAHLQSALARVYDQFYRHRFAYHHGHTNCTGISVSTARALGWQVAARGAESWLKAAVALPLTTIRELSLHQGKKMFDYLSEDQTRLYPAAAFEEMGADLLRLASGQGGRPLSEFERLLGEDVVEILLVRVPQFPSSRAWGDYPVENSVEYRARLPKNPADQQIVPVPLRPFPEELRDPLAPAEPPLRSDYAVVGWGLAIVALIGLILTRVLA